MKEKDERKKDQPAPQIGTFKPGSVITEDGTMAAFNLPPKVAEPKKK